MTFEEEEVQAADSPSPPGASKKKHENYDKKSGCYVQKEVAPAMAKLFGGDDNTRHGKLYFKAAL